MKNLVKLIIASLLLTNLAFAESFLYVGQTKSINGSFKYYLPKLELNKAKYAGKLFGTPCFYLSEFEGGLVYTAPRFDAFALNHSAVEAEWHWGVEIEPFFGTYSLGGIYRIAGNNEGIPEGFEGLNSLQVGISFK